LDTARYVAALLLIVAFPPSIFYWFLIHPFIRYWRNLGAPRTLLIVLPTLVFMGYGITLWRKSLLSVEYGANYLLWPLAILCYGISIKTERQLRKHLKFKSLVGVPELDRSGKGGKLLAEGIYGRMRHPRYVSLFLITLAWALFANYLATYILVPVMGLALYLVTVMEERELRQRFGEAHAQYCKRVPRFIPGVRP